MKCKYFLQISAMFWNFSCRFSVLKGQYTKFPKNKVYIPRLRKSYFDVLLTFFLLKKGKKMSKTAYLFSSKTDDQSRKGCLRLCKYFGNITGCS